MWVNQCLNWFAHVWKLDYESIFECTYCMSFQAVTALVDMLYQYIAYNYLKHGYTCAHQPLYAEIAATIGLQWLAGGSYHHLDNVYCCSVSTVYKHRLCFIHAVNLCEWLKLKFPTSATEVFSAQTQFCNIRSKIETSGCVSAMDCLLVVIKCSSMKDSNSNPSSYYSGHYCCHGLNIQAICDASY